MSDITERLRAPRCGLPMSATAADRDMYNVATREEAADEIDRLRAELAEAKAERDHAVRRCETLHDGLSAETARADDFTHGYMELRAGMALCLYFERLAEAKAQRVPDGLVAAALRLIAAIDEAEPHEHLSETNIHWYKRQLREHIAAAKGSES